jgi:signal recognition particle receptor subunit beta
MNEYKILFTGPMGAGKTTAIASISETPPVVTDVHNSDASVNKSHTTVGLDYGQLTLESGDRIRFFGTPGQDRFDFLWKILIVNSLGVVILLNNANPSPKDDLGKFLDAFAVELKTMPCVIGVGRTDSHPTPTLDEFADLLAIRQLVIPILAVDVRQASDVRLLLDMLLTQIEIGGMQPDLQPGL